LKYAWITVALFNHHKIWLGLYVGAVSIVLPWLWLIRLESVDTLTNSKVGNVKIEAASGIIFIVHYLTKTKK
jgi:hypothetical protein